MHSFLCKILFSSVWFRLCFYLFIILTDGNADNGAYNFCESPDLAGRITIVNFTIWFKTYTFVD